MKLIFFSSAIFSLHFCCVVFSWTMDKAAVSILTSFPKRGFICSHLQIGQAALLRKYNHLLCITLITKENYEKGQLFFFKCWMMHMKRGGRKQVMNAIACCFQAILLRELMGEVQYSYSNTLSADTIAYFCFALFVGSQKVGGYCRAGSAILKFCHQQKNLCSSTFLLTYLHCRPLVGTVSQPWTKSLKKGKQS